MRCSTRIVTRLLGTLPLLAAGFVNAAATDPVHIEWQHHRDTFAYSGFTTLYSCDGLEGQVRRILTYLGARQDAKVTATGCARGLDAPGRHAWVATDFYVPEPSAAAAAQVVGQWTPIDLTPRHPFFMDAGDCELVEEMQRLVTQNFKFRDLDYRSSCFPNALSFDGFAVKGQALKVPATPNSK